MTEALPAAASAKRAVCFRADNAPYRAGETASFEPARAARLVAAGVARYADGGDLTDALIDADPQDGKRTGRAERYAKKG